VPMPTKTGTCGWARLYQAFPSSEMKGKTSLQFYAERFPVVEINSSYYKHHRISTYENWRRETPDKFEFTMKCHKYVSQRPKLVPTNEVLESFQESVEEAGACKAKAILIQTPSSLRATEDVLEAADSFFAKIDTEGIPVAWETRGESWEDDKSRARLAQLLQKYNVTHVTDPFKNDSVFVREMAYFRLHGLPGYNLKYTYTNGELIGLNGKIKPLEKKVKTVYVFFNNYAMYRDAERFISLLKNRRLPPSPFGPRSVTYALRSFENWPATKDELMERCGGWYVWIAPSRTVKLKEILKHIKDGDYNDVDEMEEESTRIWDKTGFPNTDDIERV